MISKWIPLIASLDKNLPEVPSIFTLLFHGSESVWAVFFSHWETIIFSIGIAIIISIIFTIGARRKELIPEGLQNFLEFFVESFQKVAYEIIGKTGEKYVPLLGTLFIYILAMNWVAFIPLLKAPSSNLNITVALAFCVFVLVQFLSIKNYGIFGYLYHLAGSPKGIGSWLFVPLMFPIEILTQLSRPITLAFRLFGNILGEDILIGTFALFGVTLFAASHIPIPVPLQFPFMLFALLTGLMQALVFTLLTAIYILLSMPSEDH